MHHFGAFYKASWRANDWMWGRLDGCGWLVHVLLDPGRILEVLENDRVHIGSRVERFVGDLSRALEAPVPNDLRAELAFLDLEAEPLPASLPGLALWVAGVLQQHIAAQELPVVAAQLRSKDDGGSSATTTWLVDFDQADWRGGATPRTEVLAKLLDTCPVAAETLRAEAGKRTPLYLRTVTQAVAVATSAVSGISNAPPASLRPTLATARAATQGAYVAAREADGRRRRTTLIGAFLLLVGVLAMLAHAVIFGLGGLVLFATGALLVRCRWVARPWRRCACCWFSAWCWWRPFPGCPGCTTGCSRG
jgi:hypothetical protein